MFYIKRTLTCKSWCHFANPFQVMTTWSIVPGLVRIAPGIRSCTVFIATVVGLSIIPVPEMNHQNHHNGFVTVSN